MTFSCTVEINANIDKVQSIFLDSSTLKYYQDGFISKTLISGNEGTKGAKSKLIYEKLELIEMILNNDLPNEFLGLYEHKYMTNTMRVSLTSIANNRTLYSTAIEYTKLNGFIIQVMAKLFSGLFKKQVQKWLNQFKQYVEGG